MAPEPPISSPSSGLVDTEKNHPEGRFVGGEEKAIVALVSTELLFGSRIVAAALRAQMAPIRCDRPAQLPSAESVSLALVDWGERAPGWGEELRDWIESVPKASRPRLVLFGPHTDRAAHAAARAAGLGPMWARSKLLAALDELLGLTATRRLEELALRKPGPVEGR